jgi:hypothetical protein
MKSKNVLLGILAITLIFTMTVAGCDLLFGKDDDGNDNGNDNENGNSNGNGSPGTGGGDIAVTFSSVTADGSATQTTTQLTLTFSQAITGLSASNITLSGVTGVTKGTLSGSGPAYTLSISGLTAGGTLDVAVAKSGYTISGSPQSVTIFLTDFVYTETANAITITKYQGAGGDVIIPEQINGKPVTAIGTGNAFVSSSITSVTIPKSVTSIDDSSFFNSSNLMAIKVDTDNTAYTSVDGVLYTKDKKR